MTAPDDVPPPTTSTTTDPPLRRLYLIVVVVAAIALALTLYNASADAAAGHPRPFAWLLPVGILCVGVGGLVGPRRPGLRRILLSVSVVLAVASLALLLARR